MKTPFITGTIVYEPDGTSAEWDFVEHVPYDPVCYQNDEGIIVFVPAYPGAVDHGNEYYISLTDGSVWRLGDDDAIEGAHCPEIKRRADEFEALMSQKG